MSIKNVHQYDWQKNAINPFFDASEYKNIGATIRIGQEIWCLLYAGFLIYKAQEFKPDMI